MTHHRNFGFSAPPGEKRKRDPLLDPLDWRFADTLMVSVALWLGIFIIGKAVWEAMS